MEFGLYEIKISCYHFLGFLRSLETLYQIALQTQSIEISIQDKIFLIIEDEPLFQHRGLMIDTARSFIETHTLKKVIDSMMYAKLNVLHLHLTDGDSFPIKIENFQPQQEKFYSEDDIKDLIEYGFDRGVSIIAEIDSPSHTFSWSHFDESINMCQDYYHQLNWKKYCPTPPCGQLDISNQKTYEIIKKILNQIQIQFPNEYIHLGGDEVGLLCYTENSQMKSWLDSQNLKSIEQIQTFYRNKILQFVYKKPIFWAFEIENLFKDFPQNSTIQIWQKQNETIQKASCHKNQNVILSYSDIMYLDCGYGNILGENSWCDPMSNWKHMYYNFQNTLENCQVLGGELCLWTELVNDYNIFQKIWSRSAAIAERLWNPKIESDLKILVERLVQFEKRLEIENIKYSPITSNWCQQNIQKCFNNI